MSGYVTKADCITAEVLADLEQTPCGLPCGGCNTVLVTERDFAEHFVLTDGHHLNLGECPNTEKGRAIMARGTRNIPFLQKGPSVKARPLTTEEN